MESILIKLVAQIPLNLTDRIDYQFNGDKITAQSGNVTETFDFTGLPDGELEIEAHKMKTELPSYPIISAEKKNNELKVVILNYVGPQATEESTTYPWMTPEEYLERRKLEVESDERFLEE